MFCSGGESRFNYRCNIYFAKYGFSVKLSDETAITTKLRANSSSNSSSFETVNRSIDTLTVILTQAAVVFALNARVHTRQNTRYTKENGLDKKTELITGKEDGCLVKAN